MVRPVRKAQVLSRYSGTGLTPPAGEMAFGDNVAGHTELHRAVHAGYVEMGPAAHLLKAEERRNRGKCK